MIGVDSNVIIRYVAQDDVVQSASATRLFESFSSDAPGFISVVALIETVWVLRSFYDSSRQQIQRVIQTLLRARGVVVERSDLVGTALSAYSQGNADFADYLIERHGRAAGCDYSMTFDRDVANTAGMKLLR
jgi:predicted nucleic-acid-binding protein